MPAPKAPFAEFKGKQRLTERDVKLLLRRLYDGKISTRQLREGGYSLTPDQVEKGRKWLMAQWVTPKGVERKNNPFGYREQEILERFRTIRLADVHDISLYRSAFKNYVPIYECLGAGDGFQYYIQGGTISIVG
jgi:hypothetical protein